jgi:hypothetical protein
MLYNFSKASQSLVALSKISVKLYEGIAYDNLYLASRRGLELAPFWTDWQ